MSDRLAAAQAHARRGWRVFPVLPRRKEPLIKGWRDQATSDPHALADWWRGCQDANTAVLCGEGSGFWALDIDVDKKGEASLAQLERQHGRLPVTVEQHTGGGGRHLLFRWNGEPITNSSGRIGPGLDVRTTGGYILVPESTHPNGQPYFWDVQGHPDNVELGSAPEWLIKLATGPTGKANGSSVQKRGPSVDLPSDPLERAAVLIATVPPGQQETTLNSEAFKIGLHIGALLIDRSRADSGLLDAAKQMKNQDGRPPWSIEVLQRKIKRALDDGIEKVLPELVELNRRHFVACVGGKTFVITERDVADELIDLRYSTITDFRAIYHNRWANDPFLERQPRLGTWWFSHRMRRQYDGVVFDPSNTAGRHLYNTWRGFAVEPRPGDWSLLRQHILDNVCYGDQRSCDYLMGWMAHLVQKATERPGVAIVLRGRRGTGKGVFVSALGKLFGSHYLPTAHGNHLSGRFNSHLMDTLLMFADEAFAPGDKACESVIKALITEDTIAIEAKFRNLEVVKNYVRLIFASNETAVVPAGSDERRFLVLDVSPARAQDHAYFAAVVDQLENGGYEAMLYDLLHLDLTGFNVRRAPDTPALRDQKVLSMSYVEEWWEERLEAGAIDRRPWGEIEIDRVYESYREYAEQAKVRQPLTRKKLGVELKPLVPSMDRVRVRQANDRRVYCWRFPALDECRRHWDHFTLTRHDWADSHGAKEHDGQEVGPGVVPLRADSLR